MEWKVGDRVFMDIPDDVVHDIRAVVFGPPKGGQEALDAAVKRLRQLVGSGDAPAPTMPPGRHLH